MPRASPLETLSAIGGSYFISGALTCSSLSRLGNWNLRLIILKLRLRGSLLRKDKATQTGRTGKENTHLETSITRHKLHIKKLELILRLLDNDELSPEEVNDVKDFLDDYVERNQEDFDDFSDVDDLYNSLPLDKVESLEDLVTIGPPGLVKVNYNGWQPVLLTASHFRDGNAIFFATVASPHHESAVVQDQADDTASQDSNSGIVARTPRAKSSMVGLSAPSTPTGNHAPISVNVQAQTLPGLSAASPTLPGSTSVRGVLENAAPSSPITLGNSMKEEEVAGFPGRISSPSLADAGLARGISRVPSNGALGSVPLASDIAKRNILGTDDRLGSGGMVQPLASSSNRMILPQAGKAGDGTGAVDSSSSGEAGYYGWQSFLSFGHWHAMETWEFLSKSERTALALMPMTFICDGHHPSSGMKAQGGQFRARTEIAPDQRENFCSFNSQSSSVSQASLGHGVQASGFNAVTSAALQQPNSIHRQSSQQVVMSSGAKDPEIGHSTVEEQQLMQNLPEDSTTESAHTSGLGKSLVYEDELTSPYTMDTSHHLPTDLLDTVISILKGFCILSTPSPKWGRGWRDSLTPPSCPQVQLPMASNPAFWERLSMHSYGTDTMFFAFYYQQFLFVIPSLQASSQTIIMCRYLSAISGCERAKEAFLEIPLKIQHLDMCVFDFHVGNEDKQGWYVDFDLTLHPMIACELVACWSNAIEFGGNENTEFGLYFIFLVPLQRKFLPSKKASQFGFTLHLNLCPSRLLPTSVSATYISLPLASRFSAYPSLCNQPTNHYPSAI
uniref:CCR4-Not complex component Not N-terminal domain-containing protein n=1 Tax=Salix viminalis TaxID=40686 RepID=A0A6N2N2V2_SALVM